MNLMLNNQPIHIQRLNDELAALGLPGYSGVARLSRDLVSREAMPPYILVKCNDLTPQQESDVQAALAAHDPTPSAPPTLRDFRAEIDAARDLAELKAVLKDYVR